MMLKVIARTVGLHQLILLNFYPYLQKYVQVCVLIIAFCGLLCNGILICCFLCLLQPHQRDITNILAAAVQACHDMVCLWFCWAYFLLIVMSFLSIGNTTVGLFCWSDYIFGPWLYQVPPDAVEPLFKQIVNQFVHDRSRTEVLVVWKILDFEILGIPRASKMMWHLFYKFFLSSVFWNLNGAPPFANLWMSMLVSLLSFLCLYVWFSECFSFSSFFPPL